MPASVIKDFQRYERGKQTITFLVNTFILLGFISEIISFFRIYLPLQLYLQIFSTGFFAFTLILLAIDRKRFYGLCYLLITYFLILNIIVYDVFFPQFIEKLQFLRSEFFSRNMFILLPLVTFVGFISGKKHVLIQGGILLLYVVFEALVNESNFLNASIATYFLAIAGFSWAGYFLVSTNQAFIKDLNETNQKLKDAQQNLVQSEKMASLGTLTAGVAHEINNPLNFINGGIEIISDLKKEMTGDLSAESLEQFDAGLKMINTGFERSNNIVQALLSFSDRGSSARTSSGITEIIDNTLLFLQPKITHDIRIIKNYDFDGKAEVYKGKIHQVFASIFENAIYALNQSERTNKQIEITTRQQDKIVAIEIRNNGPQIEDKFMNQIFDPFFSTRETGEGTGLGLSISFALVAEHGGRLYARNIAEGVAFIIELPI
jgi:signal transduction histidine kinase